MSDVSFYAIIGECTRKLYNGELLNVDFMAPVGDRPLDTWRQSREHISMLKSRGIEEIDRHTGERDTILLLNVF